MIPVFYEANEIILGMRRESQTWSRNQYAPFSNSANLAHPPINARALILALIARHVLVWCPLNSRHNSGPFSDFSALLMRSVSSDIALIRALKNQKNDLGII